MKTENKHIISIVDEFSVKDRTVNRHLSQKKDGNFIENQYIRDEYFNFTEKTIELTKEEAELWKKKYVPKTEDCEIIYEDKNVDLLAGWTKKMLYKSPDGRYFEISEKMNDWDYSSLFTTIWIAKGTEVE